MATTVKRKRQLSEVMLTVRVPTELIKLLDAEAARLARERAGAAVSRADVIRETLYRAFKPPKP